MRVLALGFAALAFLAVSCTSVTEITEPDQKKLILRPASFGDLGGWTSDTQTAALVAFARSCERMKGKDPAQSFGTIGGTYADWQPVCADMALRQNALANEDAARAFIETWFQPWAAEADDGENTGLFTGYYEASLRGSRTRHGPYQTPLRRRPDDLVMVDLGLFRDSLKGQRIAGRVVNGDLKPFEDHRAIDSGKLPGDDKLPIVWVDDPVKAFFLQIQGSGRVILDDGTTLSLGYAAQNGHAYYAIGRELVKRGVMSRDQVSMQSIESWLKAHPGDAAELMYLNPSYVFFAETGKAGAIGGENVLLTPGRSLAADRGKIPYGIPTWLDIPESPAGPIRRLMVIQDTGGAIRGPVRGDVFFGFGAEAENHAGAMKAQGRWWFLLPKTVRPIY